VPHVNRKSLFIILLLILTRIPAAQDTAEEDEINSLLQQAREEIAALEEQIDMEEARLTRIDAELVQLRRENAIHSSAESAFELGEELYTAGSIVWARDAFESVVANFPDSRYYVQALFRLELINFELQEFETALDYFDRLTDESPGFEHIDLAIISGALCKYNLGDFASCRQLLAQVSPSGDYISLAEYLTAVAYVEEGDMEQAKRALREILDHTGPSSEEAALADRARIAMAQILVEEGLYEDAISEYRRISPFSPYYDVGMLGMVWTYMRLERYQDAYNLADRVLQEVPNTELRSEYELAMANCALGAEDLEIAIEKYQRLLNQYRQTTDYYDLMLTGTSLPDQYSAERERLDRIRLGLSELKEEAYTQGNLDLVAMIEDEEASLRELFVQISRMESQMSMPVDMDAESMERELTRLISYSRSETEALALSVEEVVTLAESRGTEQERQDLARVEREVDRIRLALQDLASKFESGISQQHDWVSETQYGIAIATYMGRELKRDSLQYIGARFQRDISQAYAAGDTVRAEALITQRQIETAALQQRIDEAAVTSASFFEEYLAHYPESRFVADVLVRLAQLYYDIDKVAYLDRVSESGDAFIPEDYSRSVALYERVLSQYPGSEVEDVALYSLGYCLNQMGDPQGAVSKYRQLLRDYPESQLAAETYIRAGDFYFDSFYFDSARVFYTNILNYPGADPDLFQLGIYKLGWTHYLLNNYLRSVAVFGYLIRDSSLMDSLGISRRGGAMVDEAMEYMAHDFMEQNYTSAVPLATTFLDRYDDGDVSFSVLRHMGDFYSEQGYWREAIQSYEALIERDPNSTEAPFIQAAIASCYEGTGDYQAAAQAREALVEHYGAGSEWAQLVGEEYPFEAIDSLRARSLEQAITYYLGQASSPDVDPAQKNVYYQNLVGRIDTYLQEYGDSRESYDFRFYQGDAYYALGRYTLAGDTYLAVARDSSSSQRLENAINNGFSSYFNAYSEEVGADSSYLRDGMRDFAFMYVERFPTGENADQFLFAVAANYYNVADYPNAR
jgi:tetratricopeptide (TPR) repeat protein